MNMQSADRAVLCWPRPSQQLKRPETCIDVICKLHVGHAVVGSCVTSTLRRCACHTPCGSHPTAMHLSCLSSLGGDGHQALLYMSCQDEEVHLGLLAL